MTVVNAWFVRNYDRGGATYLCGCMCELRGGGIREESPFDTDNITCPECVRIIRQFSL